MNELIPIAPVNPLRQRLIDDMDLRRFSRETQRNYIRDVGRFATFLGRPPGTATEEEVRGVLDRAAQQRCPGAEHEQHRVGAAVLLHPLARPTGPGAPAGPGGASSQVAGDVEPRRDRPPAERHHLPQASGGAVGRLCVSTTQRHAAEASLRRSSSTVSPVNKPRDSRTLSDGSRPKSTKACQISEATDFQWESRRCRCSKRESTITLSHRQALSGDLTHGARQANGRYRTDIDVARYVICR